jgi:hypothetical protein
VPVTLTLQAAYRYLWWYGGVAQVLSGQRGGPAPRGGRLVELSVQAPDGATTAYSAWTASDGRFSVSATGLGVGQRGTWRGQARDAASGVLSNVVTWDVKWFRARLAQ